jgi:hypothetical protein
MKLYDAGAHVACIIFHFTENIASAMWSYADHRKAVRKDRANSEWRNVATR